MALSTAVISFDVSDLLGQDFNPAKTKVRVRTNVPGETLVDTVGNQIRLGDGSASIGADGTGTITVWVPGTGSNPASWQTYIEFDYVKGGANGKREPRTFGPFTVTADANLADLIAEQEVPPTYLSQVTADLDALVDDAEAAQAAAEAAAAAAVDISGISTSDGVVSALVAGTGGAGPLTRAELSKGIAAAVQTVVPRSNRAVFLGDSTVTEGSSGTRSWFLSWPLLTSMYMGGRMVRAANFALSGTTSIGVLNNQIPQVLADPIGFGRAFLCIGTNDIATGMGGIQSGITPATTRATITQIVDILTAANIAVTLVTIGPRGAAAVTAGASGPVPDVHAKTQAHNAWLKAFAQARHLDVTDFWAQDVNPLTGEFKTGYSADIIHPAGPGIEQNAQRAAIVNRDRFPAWTPPLAGAFDEGLLSRQLLANPLLTDTNADGLPDGWTVDGALSSNYVLATVPAVGAPGNELRISNIGGPPGGARVLAPEITTNFAPGDTLGIGLRLRVTSTVGAESIIYSVKVTYVGATSNGTFAPINAWQTTLQSPGTLWLEDVVPPGTTSIQLEVRTTTTSQGQLVVARPTIRNLSTPLPNGWWAA